MFNKIGILLMLVCGLFVQAACRSDKSRLIDEKVAERVAAFREKETTKCREVLLADAEHIVDSLLQAEALLDVSDSLSRIRPVRPFKPQPVLPIDSLSVKPLFER